MKPFVCLYPGRRTIIETIFLKGWVEGWEAATPADAAPEAVARRRAEAVLYLLDRRLIPLLDGDRRHILQCTDPEIQDCWMEMAIECGTVVDLFAAERAADQAST